MPGIWQIDWLYYNWNFWRIPDYGKHSIVTPGYKAYLLNVKVHADYKSIFSDTLLFLVHIRGVHKWNTRFCLAAGLRNLSFSIYCATQGGIHMGGSTIPCRRGRQPSRSGRPTYKFARFSQKLYEIKKNLVRRGGARRGRSLGSATDTGMGQVLTFAHGGVVEYCASQNATVATVVNE